MLNSWESCYDVRIQHPASESTEDLALVSHFVTTQTMWIAKLELSIEYLFIRKQDETRSFDSPIVPSRKTEHEILCKDCSNFVKAAILEIALIGGISVVY